jgi:3-oxoacyl-[acyl-carrier protein] reductase
MSTRDARAEAGGRVVVVTGVGKSGQAGEAVAHAFAAGGSTVHCIGRGDETAQRAREMQARGWTAHAHLVDLSDFGATRTAANAIASAHGGRIDVVAALAGGFAAAGPVADTPREALGEQLSINLLTAFSTACGFAPAVRAAQGVFVFVTSAAALPGGSPAGIGAYAAAKAGVIQLVRALAKEEQGHGVRVFGLAPVAIRTAENVAAMGNERRYVGREEFAATVLALCGPQFAHASGEIIRLA